MKKIYVVFFLGFIYSFSCKSQSSFYLDSIDGAAIFKKDCIYYYSGLTLAKGDYDGNIFWVKNLPVTYDISIGEDAIYCLDSLKIIKLDTSGSFIWARDIYSPVNPASSDTNAISDIVYDGRRIYISEIQAPHWGSTSIDYYPSIITLDTSGNVLNVSANHVQTGGGFYLEECSNILQGGAWIGYNYQPGFTHSSSVIKVDSTGNYDQTAFESSYFFSTVTYLKGIVPLYDSTYLVLTYSWPYNPGLLYQFFTCTKIDSQGNVFWQYNYYNSSFSCGYEATDVYGAGSDSLGNIYMIGTASENPCVGTPSGGIFYMKLDGLGNIVFVKSYGSELPSIGVSGEMKYRNGSLYCSASYQGHPAVLILDTSFTNSCFNPDSAIVLNKVPETIFGSPITSTPPILLYTAGVDSSVITNGSNGIKNDLCFTVPSPDVQKINKEFNVYPNPTTGKLKIKNDQLIIETIHVYNIFGEEVMPLHSRDEIDLTPLPEGMYIIEVSGENFLRRTKILKTNY